MKNGGHNLCLAVKGTDDNMLIVLEFYNELIPTMIKVHRLHIHGAVLDCVTNRTESIRFLSIPLYVICYG